MFVTLDDIGADGLVPISTLADDYYVHDERRHALVGERTGREYPLGAAVDVRLAEADVITGSLRLELIEERAQETDRARLKSRPRGGKKPVKRRGRRH